MRIASEPHTPCAQERRNAKRAIVMALHQFEQVKDAFRLLSFEGVGFVVEFLIHFGVVAKDF